MQVKPDNTNELNEDLSEISLAKPEEQNQQQQQQQYKQHQNEKLNNYKTDKNEQEMKNNSSKNNNSNNSSSSSSNNVNNGLNHRDNHKINNTNSKNIEQFKMNKAIFALKTKGQIKEQSEYISKTNIYIKGLSENTTDDDLFNMCSKYGEIKSTKSIIDKETSRCKGYGFVDFKDPHDALKALDGMQKEKMDVQLAKQRIQDPTNLYFANLPIDIDENLIIDMLSKKFEATVISARIMREKNGCSKGVGFARVNDQKVCDNIIQELNGNIFPNHQDNSKILIVKLADSWTLTETKNAKNYSDLLADELSSYYPTYSARLNSSQNIDNFKYFNSYFMNNYLNSNNNSKSIYSNYDFSYENYGKSRNGEFYNQYLPTTVLNGGYGYPPPPPPHHHHHHHHHQTPFQIDQFTNINYSYNNYLIPSYVMPASQQYCQQQMNKRNPDKSQSQHQQQQPVPTPPPPPSSSTLITNKIKQ